MNDPLNTLIADIAASPFDFTIRWVNRQSAYYVQCSYAGTPDDPRKGTFRGGGDSGIRSPFSKPKPPLPSYPWFCFDGWFSDLVDGLKAIYAQANEHYANRPGVQ